MVPEGQKVWTDRRNGRTDEAKTISLRLRRGIKTTATNCQSIYGPRCEKTCFSICKQQRCRFSREACKPQLVLARGPAGRRSQSSLGRQAFKNFRNSILNPCHVELLLSSSFSKGLWIQTSWLLIKPFDQEQHCFPL